MFYKQCEEWAAYLLDAWYLEPVESGVTDVKGVKTRQCERYSHFVGIDGRVKLQW